MKKILVIEDDVNILRGLRDNLVFEGYEVSTASDGQEGLKIALDESFDLILLDIMLPNVNGYDICRKVKETKPELPIVMLTARGEEVDKIAGLDLGADDYVTKPFSIPELMARIRAVLRRTDFQKVSNEVYSFANISLDFKKQLASREGKEIKMTTREYIIQYTEVNQAAGDAPVVFPRERANGPIYTSP